MDEFLQGKIHFCRAKTSDTSPPPNESMMVMPISQIIEKLGSLRNSARLRPHLVFAPNNEPSEGPRSASKAIWLLEADLTLTYVISATCSMQHMRHNNIMQTETVLWRFWYKIWHLLNDSPLNFIEFGAIQSFAK